MEIVVDSASNAAAQAGLYAAMSAREPGDRRIRVVATDAATFPEYYAELGFALRPSDLPVNTFVVVGVVKGGERDGLGVAGLVVYATDGSVDQCLLVTQSGEEDREGDLALKRVVGLLAELRS